MSVFKSFQHDDAKLNRLLDELVRAVNRSQPSVTAPVPVQAPTRPGRDALNTGTIASQDADRVTITGGLLTGVTIGGGTRGVTNAQTGSAYTLVDTDSGKIITCENASDITVTVPAGLGAGFNCTIIQKGAGTVTLSAGSGVTVNHRQSHTDTGGQHAVVGLFSDVADNFYLAGDTA